MNYFAVKSIRNHYLPSVRQIHEPLRCNLIQTWVGSVHWAWHAKLTSKHRQKPSDETARFVLRHLNSSVQSFIRRKHKEAMAGWWMTCTASTSRCTQTRTSHISPPFSHQNLFRWSWRTLRMQAEDMSDLQEGLWSSASLCLFVLSPRAERFEENISLQLWLQLDDHFHY